ncbi:MAG: hypothetical protein K2N85_07930 [Lachnospiraceae bacterium]|nr:hypothetical protein [Lachnospiraceae bacterium]
MKEIMTEVSVNAGENEKECKKNSNMMIIYVMGAIVLVVCILCLLMLWRKIADRNNTVLKSETYTEAVDAVMANAPNEDLTELQKTTIEESYEISVSERAQEEEIRQQYLTDMEYLREKVESLLQFMSTTKEALEKVVKEQEGDVLLKEQVNEITSKIVKLMIQLQTEQERISELKEALTVMNNETILDVQGNISEIKAQMNTIDSDISYIYTQINSLKTSDAELQKEIEEIEKNLKTSAEQNMKDILNQFDSINDKMQQIEGDTQTKIEEVEKNLKTSAEQNMTNVTNQFNSMSDKMQQMEGDTQTKVENIQKEISSIQNNIQQIESQLLRYRYDAESNTLYLYPN